MNAICGPTTSRLLWKEMRIMCPFAASVIAMALVLLLISIGQSGHEPTHWTIDFIVTITPVMLLVGGIATSFSMEHENETFIGQRLLPATAKQIFGSKLIVPCLIAAICLVLMLATVGLLKPSALQTFHLGDWLLVAGELSVWSALFSMMIRRPLLALAAAALFDVALVSVITLSFQHFTSVRGPHLGETILRSMIVAGVFALNWKLVIPWFDDQLEPLAGWSPRRSSTLAWTRVSRGHPGPWRRVLWLFRSSRGLAIGGLFVAAMVNSFIPIANRTGETVLLINILLCGGMGSLVFGQTPRDCHVLAIHGCRHGTYWAGRLLYPVLAVSITWFVTGVMIQRGFSGQSMEIAGFVVAAFCVGQLVSMLTRQLLLSIAASFFGSILMGFWCLTNYRGTMPLSLTLVPLIILPLVITRMRAGIWLNDWADKSARRVKLATVLIPCLVYLASIAVYRVTEIPALTVAERQQIQKIPAVPPEKLERYRDVTGLISRQGLTPGNRKKYFRDLASTDVDMSAADFGRVDDSHSILLVNGLYYAVAAAVEEQDVEAARLGFRAQQRAREIQLKSFPGYPSIYGLPHAQHCVSWAQLESVTDEQLDDLIDELTAGAPSQRDIDTMIKAINTLNDRKSHLMSDQMLIDTLALSDFESFAFRSIYGLLFWEQYRLQRYSQLTSSRRIKASGRAFEMISRGQQIPDSEEWSRRGHPWPFLIHPIYFSAPQWSKSIRFDTRHNRLARIGLALVRYRRHNGELPRSLDQISDSIGKETLIDPISGQPFMYFPEGLPQEWIEAVKSTEPLDLDAELDAEIEIDYSLPFVWSPLYRTRRDGDDPLTATFELDKRWVNPSQTGDFTLKDLLLPHADLVYAQYHFGQPSPEAMIQLQKSSGRPQPERTSSSSE